MRRGKDGRVYGDERLGEISYRLSQLESNLIPRPSGFDEMEAIQSERSALFKELEELCYEADVLLAITRYAINEANAAVKLLKAAADPETEVKGLTQGVG